MFCFLFWDENFSSYETFDLEKSLEVEDIHKIFQQGVDCFACKIALVKYTDYMVGKPNF